MVEENPPALAVFPHPALHKDTDAWCFLNFVLCERSAGRVSGSVLNFTGLRNSRFTGNTDHLAQACDRPEVGGLSPDLLTTSLGPLNRWDCQGERAVPEGGFAVIDQWNSDSASPVCLCEFTCACSFSVLTLRCVVHVWNVFCRCGEKKNQQPLQPWGPWVFRSHDQSSAIWTVPEPMSTSNPLVTRHRGI